MKNGIAFRVDKVKDLGVKILKLTLLKTIQIYEFGGKMKCEQILTAGDSKNMEVSELGRCL